MGNSTKPTGTKDQLKPAPARQKTDPPGQAPGSILPALGMCSETDISAAQHGVHTDGDRLPGDDE